MDAVKYWLEKYPVERKSQRFSNDFIIKGIQFILENNTFSFDDNVYKQNKSTAMGTKFAPVYATLTIGYLEENIYQEINTLFGKDFGTYFMTNWKRFLDDCFVPWTKSSEDLATLHTTVKQNYIKISDAHFSITIRNSLS